MLRAGITLYFVRHGETDWNFAQRYQGQQDIPLNATGRAQASGNGRKLARELGSEVATFDFVASPLSRARNTMELIRAELDLPEQGYRTDERLMEIHYGHWEGQLLRELPAADPSGFAARQADAWSWQPRGGESYQALSDRVAEWAGEVVRPSVVVAHGGVSRVLRGIALGLATSEVPFLEVPQDKVLVIEAGSLRWL